MDAYSRSGRLILESNGTSGDIVSVYSIDGTEVYSDILPKGETALNQPGIIYRRCTRLLPPRACEINPHIQQQKRPRIKSAGPLLLLYADSIFDQRCDFSVGREVGPAVEHTQFYDEIDINFLRVHALHQLIARHGSAGGKHIIVEHTISSSVMASRCISIVSLPYSLSYEAWRVSAGSLPGFLTGTKPAPSSKARIEPR